MNPAAINLAPQPGAYKAGAALGSLAISLLIFLAISSSQNVQIEEEREDPVTIAAIDLLPPPPPPPQERTRQREVATPTLPDLSDAQSNAAFTSAREIVFQAPPPEAFIDFALDANAFRPDATEWKPDYVFDTHEVDEAPTVVYSPTPELSRKLVESVALESVTLLYIINKDGIVEKPYLLNSTSKEFNQVILNAIRQWRFKPPTKNGEPANVLVKQRIRITPSSKGNPFQRP